MHANFAWIRQRPDRERIRDEWILQAIESPLARSLQSDGRIRCWTWIPEEQRHLRVVLLPDGATVHNAFFRQTIPRMRIRYFRDTDTLWIELRNAEISETRDLDANTLADIDAAGNICSITLEHASELADVTGVSFERVPA